MWGYEFDAVAADAAVAAAAADAVADGGVVASLWRMIHHTS